MTICEFTPSRVRNIFICIAVAFCASSRMTNASRERAAAHERERRDLDDPRLERALHPLLRHHVVERVVQRPEIRIDLGLHVAGQEAEALARLDRRPREDDAPHALPRQRVDRRGDGEVGLARARRPDADDDVVVARSSQVLGLAARLRLDELAARPGSAIRPSPAPPPVAVPAAVVLAEPKHVVGRELHAAAAPRSIMRRAMSRRARHELGRPGDRHRVAAQRDLHPAEARQLDEVAVVHAGEREQVGAFGGQLLRD